MVPVPGKISLRRFGFVVFTAIVPYGLNLRGTSFSPSPKKVANTSFYAGMKFFSKNNFILCLSWGTVFTARGIIGL